MKWDKNNKKKLIYKINYMILELKEQFSYKILMKKKNYNNKNKITKKK